VRMTARGFPHSDIPGSKPAYGSPRHFVVRHVLLRLLAPRHPPCALPCLTKSLLSQCLSSRCLLPCSHGQTFIFGCSSASFLLLRFAIQFSRNSVVLFAFFGDKSYLTTSAFDIQPPIPGFPVFFCVLGGAWLVEPRGIEPLTSCVQGRRSPS